MCEEMTSFDAYRSLPHVLAYLSRESAHEA